MKELNLIINGFDEPFAQRILEGALAGVPIRFFVSLVLKQNSLPKFSAEERVWLPHHD